MRDITYKASAEKCAAPEENVTDEKSETVEAGAKTETKALWYISGCLVSMLKALSSRIYQGCLTVVRT